MQSVQVYQALPPVFRGVWGPGASVPPCGEKSEDTGGLWSGHMWGSQGREARLVPGGPVSPCLGREWPGFLPPQRTPAHPSAPQPVFLGELCLALPGAGAEAGTRGFGRLSAPTLTWAPASCCQNGGTHRSLLGR